MADASSKVQFVGPQYQQILTRLKSHLFVASIGAPSSGKTMANKMALLAYDGTDPEQLNYEQFEKEFRKLIVSEKISVSVGRASQEPEDLVGSFVRAGRVECTNCSWHTVAYEGQSFRTCATCGSPTRHEDIGLTFRYGPLSRAMGAGRDDNVGVPFFYNEMSRAPRRTQDVLLAPFSDGYLSIEATGETIVAKDGFCGVLDMNTEEHGEEVTRFAWALGSRLRKITFPQPDEQAVRRILKNRIGDDSVLVEPIVAVFQEVRAKTISGELPRQMIARGAIDWAADLQLLLNHGTEQKEAFRDSARATWLLDVAGSREQLQNQVLSIVDQIGSQYDLLSGQGVLLSSERLFAECYYTLRNCLGVERLPQKGLRQALNLAKIEDYSELWELLKVQLTQFEGFGDVLVNRIHTVLKGTQHRTRHLYPEYKLGSLLKHFIQLDREDLSDAYVHKLLHEVHDSSGNQLETFEQLDAYIMENSGAPDFGTFYRTSSHLLDSWWSDHPDKVTNLIHSGVVL